MTFTQKKTPSGQTGGISHKTMLDHTANGDDSTLHEFVDRGAVFGQALDGIYIVVAEIKSPGPEPRYRRRFYAQLASAQLAVDRARMNGRDAYLYIGQITIVEGGGHIG